MQRISGALTARSQERSRGSSLAATGPYLHLTARRAESRSRSSGAGFSPRCDGGRALTCDASRPSPRHRKERFVHDEPMEDRPRRRPVLLAMLLAAALLLAIAGSGALGSGTSRSSDDGVGVQGAPPATQ